MLISDNHDALVKPADWWLHPREWGELARFDVTAEQKVSSELFASSPPGKQESVLFGRNVYGMYRIRKMNNYKMAIPVSEVIILLYCWNIGHMDRQRNEIHY